MKTMHPTHLNPDQQQHLIDVRTPDEFTREHIPGSQNIPLDQLSSHIAALQGLSPIILTCRSGRRALEAFQILESHGLSDLALLEGGLEGWKQAQRPTQSLKTGISIMRQVQITVGAMVLIGLLIDPLRILSFIAGIGLMIAGVTNTCLMYTLLGKMPWNKLASSPSGTCSLPSMH